MVEVPLAQQLGAKSPEDLQQYLKLPEQAAEEDSLQEQLVMWPFAKTHQHGVVQPSSSELSSA